MHCLIALLPSSLLGGCFLQFEISLPYFSQLGNALLDTHNQPLNPVHPGRARILLSSGKAAVVKRYPFTIILITVVEHPVLEPLRLKIDPGSKTTGLALVNDATGEVVFAAELVHRGEQIKKALDGRRAVRRSRRNRTTRYRKPRCANRRNKKKGWLPPSLESRISNVLTWVKRLMRLCPISALSQELVKFDLQRMENPEISGVEYQQGTLLAMKYVSTYCRSGGAHASTVAQKMFHYKLNTLSPVLCE